jgi:hypothetical protein
MSPEMNPIEDDGSGGDSGSEYARLDATLRRFLSTELDGQLGRARTAFEAHVARPAATHRPRRATRSRLWVIGLAGAGAAMAASLAAVWAVPMFGGKRPSSTMVVDVVQPPQPHAPSSRPGERSAGNASPAIDWEPVRQVSTTAVRDGGTLVVGGAPARVVKSVSTERIEYFDPGRNVRVETTVPQERVMLIGVDTY